MTAENVLRWADAVCRERELAPGAHRPSVASLRGHKRVAAHRRAPRRIGAWRLAPLAVAATTLTVGASVGTAYAYLGTTGSGTGEGRVGTLLPVKVEDASATVMKALVPGGSGTLLLKLTNPNNLAVTLVGVTEDGPVTVAGGGPACTSGTLGTPGSSGVSVAANVASGLDIPVARGPSVTSTVVVPTGITMSSRSSSTCQGASFHVPVTVTVHL